MNYLNHEYDLCQYIYNPQLTPLPQAVNHITLLQTARGHQSDSGEGVKEFVGSKETSYLRMFGICNTSACYLKTNKALKQGTPQF